jgi:uncharacterized membrane protein YidH (DUF202 family)
MANDGLDLSALPWGRTAMSTFQAMLVFKDFIAFVTSLDTSMSSRIHRHIDGRWRPMAFTIIVAIPDSMDAWQLAFLCNR